MLHREELDAYVVRRLNLPFRDVDWTQWNDLLRRVHEPQETVRIALVGKYIDLSDAYLSVAEALRAGGFKHHAKVEMRWVASDDCEADGGAAAVLDDVHGVLIPGGFGIRGIEGKIGAIRYARKRGLPVLGLCLGLQCIVIEAARSVGLADANSAEFDPTTPDPVISTMADQRDAVAGEADLGGTMRLGAYPAVLEPDSIVAQAYQATEVSERHRHRYEVNNEYRDRIAASGLRFSGTSPDGHLVEFVEYDPDVHPFLVGTQAHPELKSRPTRPHPLFAAFIGAALEYKAAETPAGGDPRALQRRRARRTTRSNCARTRLEENRRPWLSTTSRPSTPRPSTSARFSRCAPMRCGCRAATRRVVRWSNTTAPSRWSHSTTTATSCWSTSTATPSGAAVGAARRPAGRRRGGAAHHRRPGTRGGGRPGRRQPGRFSSTWTQRPGSATRACGCTWRPGCPTSAGRTPTTRRPT